MNLHKFNIKKEVKKLNFKRNKIKYIRVGAITIIILATVLSIIYFTYSKFTLSDMFKTAEMTVDDFIENDYMLYFYIDDVQILEIPTNKYEGTVTCDNGATGVWNKITSSVSVSNVTTKTKCHVKLYLAPAEPELYAGLIPITYDAANNILIADTNSEWYNYLNHEWANAILIDQTNEGLKNKYLNSDGTFKVGTIVDIADISQMYVWIPRYKYKLFNVEGFSIDEKQIEIKFETSATEKSIGSSNDEWLTHPAFTFGETELNGLWVGKFEPSGTTDNLTIIPNVSSLRDLNISTMFNSTRAIESTIKYGLTSSEVDTHMMKNMEWGAVAYLTNSKYGRYIDVSTCIDSGCEVWINNNNNYTTGCAGDSVSALTASTCNEWNTPTGVNASTTGNIYGIYDMSGGAWEYVMGNYNNIVASSGIDFSNIESKYYDIYTGNSISYGKLGDATKETVRWYGDFENFVVEANPWFARSGVQSYHSHSGIFGINPYSNGAAESDASWRVVLTKE